MYSTKSPSPMAQATDLILISHGSPSDPAPQERFIHALADKVANRTGLSVRGATLAAEGSLEAAVEGAGNPLIFPHFMADGWFVSTNLPRRLTKAGLAGWVMLPSLGLLPCLPQLALRGILQTAEFRIYPEAMPHLIVAAHGSPSDPRPARATERFAETLEASQRFASVSVGYVDEDPTIAAALEGHDNAVILPFFAAKAGHVLMDLPEAVDKAGFDGPVMEPLGTWPMIPDLIAQAVLAQSRVHAA